MQPKFSIRALAAGLILFAAIGLFDHWLTSIPDREELGWRMARVEFEPVEFNASAVGPLRLAGAWKMTSDDPRFGGISALAIDGRRLLALSDSGVLVRFSPLGRPPHPAWIDELPDGPRNGSFKRNRDSEALARDPLDRGWWVAFEYRHELWLYDRSFGRALRRIDLGGRGWRSNLGIEGIAAAAKSLLLVHEKGDGLLLVTGSRARAIRIAGSGGRISDIADLGSGRYIAVERRLTALGFRNALVILEKSRSGYRFVGRAALPLGPLDNVEAVAVELRADGSRRLWLMTDDNFRPPLRTLLIALDWPAPRQ